MEILIGNNSTDKLIADLNSIYNDLKQNDQKFSHLTHQDQREQVLQKFGENRKYYELFWPEWSPKPSSGIAYLIGNHL